MTARELAFIQSAAQGIRQARKDLSGPGSGAALAAALEQMAGEFDGKFTNATVAYFAMMLVEWEDRGKPNLLV